MFKSGFVSIVGRANVGKSSLLNQILQTKLAIMSDTAQTTRNTIQGIYTTEHMQVVFVDTPGIHKPQDSLGNFMNKIALNSVFGVEIILFLAPANETIGRGDRFIIERLKENKTPIFLVLTKVDLVSNEQIIQKIQEWQGLLPFAEIIPLSAKTNINVDRLLQVMEQYLPEGNCYYDKQQLTDHPERFIIAEYIREKVIFYTHDELPHNVAIVMEKMQQTDHGEVEVEATIIVNRKSQKGIIIGKQGATIKKIREAARRDCKKFLQAPIHLSLYVKVEKDWRNKPRYLKELGYNEDEY